MALMLSVGVVTLFPEMFDEIKQFGICKGAVDADLLRLALGY